MTDLLTPEEYRELAGVCDKTAGGLLDIVDAYGNLVGDTDVVDCFRTAHAFLSIVRERFSQYAEAGQAREDAERQLREDICQQIGHGPGLIEDGTVDAIIRRVREEKS